MSIENLCDMSNSRKYRAISNFPTAGSVDITNDDSHVYTLVMKYCGGIDQTILNHATKSINWDSYMADEVVDYESLARDIAMLSNYDPMFNDIAGKILMIKIKLETSNSFRRNITKLYNDEVISKDFFNFVEAHDDHEILQNMIDSVEDFNLEYTALNLVAVFINLESKQNIFSDIKTTFLRLVKREIIFASPVLYNAGTVKSQIASCFLMSLRDNHKDSIMETLDNASKIANATGGISIALHGISDKFSMVETLGLINEMADKRYDESRRKPSFAVYLEIYHKDVLTFIDARLDGGDSSKRFTSLFYGLWVSDLFMERAAFNQSWSLFCPDKLKEKGIELHKLYGSDFKKVYEKCEKEGLFDSQINATELLTRISNNTLSGGGLYVMYKDSCNKYSNQQNLGTIVSSNLCAEIIQFSSLNETATCNLASVSLGRLVENGNFNYVKLQQIVSHLVNDMNKLIDINDYPTGDTRLSNLRHRPMGIGVTGLADAFFEAGIHWDSREAKEMNSKIFQTMYFSALNASCNISCSLGKKYSSYEGSPISKGKLHFDLMGRSVDSSLCKWGQLRTKIKNYGVFNSLFIALMPTASTSLLVNMNESIEPITSNIYSRNTQHGQMLIVNRYLVAELKKMGLWDLDMINMLNIGKGSVQSIARVPDNLKQKYKTAYEISIKRIVELAIDRQKFIDQSQSLNLFTSNIDDLVTRYIQVAFAKDVFINQERKLGDRRRSDTVCLGSGGSMVARLKLKGIDGRAPPGLFLDSMGGGAWPFLVGGSIATIALQRGIPSKRESSAHVDYVPALCTHRPSLLPIEWLSETLGSTRGNLHGYLLVEKLVKLGHLEEVKVVTRFP
ncbi:10789_t:CDS:2 [Dentiscutata heterogama]|uniref:10789_t:CDS:1 n=1 Tax=Dentiscutata heterogama TaxID=1316150 RepID=A0ACA9L9G4_9GLOM|nr:10789_t:CDS:2 [Dentiscutata heterogama]